MTTPEDLLRRMRVPDKEAAYVLGCFERRVTIYSQQVRALNLVHSLLETKKLGSGKTLGIVGGGIAGLTAAAAALSEGCEVTLFEEREQLLELQTKSPRWIHPHIYDWPSPGSSNPNADLPFLDWSAGDAGKVVKEHLLPQWEKILADAGSRFEPQMKTVVTDLSGAHGQTIRYKTSERSFTDSYDVVILAVGFGMERGTSYWDGLIWAGQPSRTGPKTFLVSGCGDGGLIEVVQLKLADPDLQRIVKTLDIEEKAFEDLKVRLSEIEKDAWARANPDDVISPAYEKLARELNRKDAPLVARVLGDRIDSRTVKLNGTRPSAYTFDATPLNRLLVAMIAPEYISGEIVGDPEPIPSNNRKRVTITGQHDKLEVDEVIQRHGPDKSLTKYKLSEVYDACKPVMSVIKVLDPNPQPIYHARWPRPRARAHSAALMSGGKDPSDPPPPTPRTALDVHLQWVREYASDPVEWCRSKRISEVRVERLVRLMESDGDRTPRHPTTLIELLRFDINTNHAPRYLLLGDAGSGKTTLLREVASQLAATSPGIVPIYERVQHLLDTEHPLLVHVERTEQKLLQAPPGLAKELEQRAKAGKLVLFLDGLAEVARSRWNDVQTLLRGFINRWRNVGLVISSRIIEAAGAHSLRPVELLELDAAGRKELLRKWYGADAPVETHVWLSKLEQQVGGNDFFGNPLYLSLAALIRPGTGPKQLGTLWKQVIDCLLRGDHHGGAAPIPHLEAVRRALARIAWSLTQMSQLDIANDKLETMLYADADLREKIEQVEPWRGGKMHVFLADLQRTGILTQSAEHAQVWRFSHPTFQEAFAALAILQRLDDDKKLTLVDVIDVAEIDARIRDAALVSTVEEDPERWLKPLWMLVSGERDPAPMIRQLADKSISIAMDVASRVEKLNKETLLDLMGRPSASWQARRKLLMRMVDLAETPEDGLALLDEIRRDTRDGNDLFFIDLALHQATTLGSAIAEQAKQNRAHLFDHIPVPTEALFTILSKNGDSLACWADIPAGNFDVGSDAPEELVRTAVQRVSIPYPFRMGIAPVTYRQYAAFDGKDPFFANHPVVDVTWFEAVSFCRWLSSAFPWARGARLPRELEWEYACLGGGRGPWSCATEEELKDLAWFKGNSENKANAVLRKKPNGYGLHDMHGNVREWCIDRWESEQANSGQEVVLVEEIEPPLHPIDALRPQRGGCYQDPADLVRASSRHGTAPHKASKQAGFRVFLPRMQADSARPATEMEPRE